MKFTILTLFPDSLEGYLNSSIIKRAKSKGLLEIELINIRESHGQQVDDYAYGGGTGMVLKIEPIVNALRNNNLLDKHTVLLTPSGTSFNQNEARELSKSHSHIVLICGHYEGIDARISNYITQEISIGDYVTTSGELAALVVVDVVSRLIPGVINEQSLNSESFDDYLLDYKSYTRPQNFEGFLVPEVYLQGNHKNINKYRLEERIKLTKQKRPDLYKLYLKNKKT